MKNEKIKIISGYWIDQPATTYTVRISLGSWDEKEDDHDSQIFYYTDGAPIKVGEIIANDFLITTIH